MEIAVNATERFSRHPVETASETASGHNPRGSPLGGITEKQTNPVVAVFLAQPGLTPRTQTGEERLRLLQRLGGTEQAGVSCRILMCHKKPLMCSTSPGARALVAHDDENTLVSIYAD